VYYSQESVLPTQPSIIVVAQIVRSIIEPVRASRLLLHFFLIINRACRSPISPTNLVSCPRFFLCPVYFKQCGVGCVIPPIPATPAPTTMCGNLLPISPSQCGAAIAAIGSLSPRTPDCENTSVQCTPFSGYARRCSLFSSRPNPFLC
jgi:hypothetical protein